MSKATFEDFRKSSAVFLTPEEVGQASGWTPDGIRKQARNDPSKLGFPVVVIGTRTYIPRVPFLKYIGIEEGKQ